MGLLDILQDTEPAYKAPEAVPEQTQGHFNEILSTIKGGSNEGNRNTSFTRLAGLLRSHGLSKDVIENLLLSVNRSTNTNLPEKEIYSIARSVSRYTPKPENRQPQGADILTIEQCFKSWQDYRRFAGDCKSGFDKLDNAVSTFSPGEVFTIAGRSGTGKTNLGLQLSRGIAANLKTQCLFCSLEMNAGSVFFRLSNECYSQTTGEPKTAIETYEILKTPDFAKQVCEVNQRILTVDKDSLTLEQIETYLVTAREKYTVNLLTIDYLGYLTDTASGSSYDKVSRIAKGVKALAKRQNVRTILLCQTSRAGQDGTEPVQLHHLRDSGAIEESADYILGLWHAVTGTDEKRIHCEILKNRHGDRGFQFDFINKGLHLIEDDFKVSQGKKQKLESFDGVK